MANIPSHVGYVKPAIRFESLCQKRSPDTSLTIATVGPVLDQV